MMAFRPENKMIFPNTLKKNLEISDITNKT